MESRQDPEPKQYSPRSPASAQTQPGSSSPKPLRNMLQARRGKNEPFKKDALTGLYGQKYLCRAIDTCLKQGRSRNLTATLALLQLENFYEIRSWVGLSEADLLLADIAQLLKAALPKSVLLCRCHNYEFAALLLADCSVNAGRITEKLKHALLNAVSTSLPRQIELKCGVGLAKLEQNIPSWPVVFARARHNLSLAHHHKALPAHLSATSPEIALRQLHAAMELPELELNFQALLNFTEEPVEHYEVRCSLACNERSLPTVLLFETAARNALGEQLDRRIIEQIIGLLSDDPRPLRRLLVNLSHNSLVSIHFLRWLEERLENSKGIATQLVLQISETDALIAQHHLISFCELIERIGCKLSLANFGCTPKPLRYLSLVNASYVKLDTALFNKIEVSQVKLEFLKSLIEDLHSREIRVIAPLLEQLPILPLLWKAQVDFMQGNCLHSPSNCMDYEFFETQTIRFDDVK